MKKRSLRRVLLAALAHLAIGAALALALGAALAASVDPVNGSLLTAETFTPETESRWSVWRWDRAGATCAVSTREAEVGSYWVSQVCGPNNSTLGADASTAWCPQNADAAPGEWLELTFPKAVLPAKLRVFENSGPGTVARVTVFAADGTEVDAWRRTEPPPQVAGGIANITLFVPPAEPPLSNRVKLYLDTAAVPGWNEIDAVELVAADGNRQWASGATASSAWNRPAATTSTPPPQSLVPKYGTLRRSAQAQAQSQIRPAKAEWRCLVGYGWPMKVIYGEAELVPVTAAPGGPPAGSLGSGAGGAAGSRTGSGAGESSGAGSRLSETWGLQRGGAVPSGLVLTDLTGGDVAAGYIQVTPGGGTYINSYNPAATLTAQAAGPLPGGVGPGGTTPLPKPRRIYWPGLAVNALLFATVIAFGRLLLIVPSRFVREVSRLRSGRCIACGYDLGYDFPSGCPECGWRRPSGSGRDRIPLKTEPSAPPQDVRAA